ncbi:MAG: DUF485 domain-containing protein [Novosphingobium sp.]|nr:DUF485 domain-containing protein [Novosphingobium sp.]
MAVDEGSPGPEALAASLLKSPRFQTLVRARARLAWVLTAVMLIIFFGFILLVAFARGFLGQPVASGWTMTLGIPIGLGVIVSGIVLTAIYVRRANTRFDRLTREIREEAGL